MLGYCKTCSSVNDVESMNLACNNCYSKKPSNAKIKKSLWEILEELNFAYSTIDNKLKFGMSEDQAIISRERRVKGCLMKARESIIEILEEK